MRCLQLGAIPNAMAFQLLHFATAATIITATPAQAFLDRQSIVGRKTIAINIAMNYGRRAMYNVAANL